VVRADTRLAGQQVRLAQVKTNLDTARLNLFRLIGSPLGAPTLRPMPCASIRNRSRIPPRHRRALARDSSYR